MEIKEKFACRCHLIAAVCFFISAGITFSNSDLSYLFILQLCTGGISLYLYLRKREK